MCGIAGILSKKNIAFSHIKKMTDALAHRGPNGEGHWANEYHTVLLGHRRLSIIDLSDKGNQPMQCLGRYTIIHNGEIYNYVEVKEYLSAKGYVFFSKTDTEVIAAAFDFWGKRCLQHFDGMFAFAIWDNKEQQLFCARDRFGEKPFYYYEDDEHFVFASEMKALWTIGIQKQVNNKMLLNFLTLGQVQNPSDKEITYYDNIYALAPAHYLLFELHSFKYKLTQYWKLNKESKIDCTVEDAIEQIDVLLGLSIQKKLRSDVPIGTSLSGGLDSSTIAAYLASSKINLHTFSATFPSFERDESSFIQQITSKFQLQNFGVSPTADDLINDFEKLCYHQEEPFNSSSIFAQYKVFELAKKNNVTVLLDGQGADEIFAGYTKYIQWFLQEVLSRHKLGANINEIKQLRKNNQPFNWGIKNHLAAFLPAHAAILLERKDYRKTAYNSFIHPDFLENLKGHQWDGIHQPIITKLNDILHFNITEMGLEELLRFADRNSMAHGVEVRLPFLSHELVEFVFSLPSTLKIHQGFTKWILRKLVEKKLPIDITWRKDKVGFEPPQKNWMQTKHFDDYCMAAKQKLVNEKILSPKMLNKKTEASHAHAANNYDWRFVTAAQFL
jgi:asparagine synthase (glutamine-hydrolysing)